MSTEIEELRDDVGRLRTDLDVAWGKIEAVGGVLMALESALSESAPEVRAKLIANLRAAYRLREGVSGSENEIRFVRNVFPDL